MPMYDFRCAKCKSQFDAIVRASAASTAVSCPVCGSKRTRRLVSRIASTRRSQAGGGGDAGASCAPSG